MTLGPGKVSLSAIIADARSAADMQNSTFCSDAEFTSWANQADKDLHDILTSSNEDYNLESTTLTTDGTDSVALPAAFYKLRAVDLLVNGNEWITLQPFNLSDRNRRSYPSQARYGVDSDIRYRLRNNSLWLSPTPASGLSIRVWYVPRRYDLQAGTATITEYPHTSINFTLAAYSDELHDTLLAPGLAFTFMGHDCVYDPTESAYDATTGVFGGYNADALEEQVPYAAARLRQLILAYMTEEGVTGSISAVGATETEATYSISSSSPVYMYVENAETYSLALDYALASGATLTVNGNGCTATSDQADDPYNATTGKFYAPDFSTAMTNLEGLLNAYFTADAVDSTAEVTASGATATLTIESTDPVEWSTNDATTFALGDYTYFVTAIDAINGYDSYLSTAAAVAALQKEESDPSVLMAELSKIEKRIEESVKPRDMGRPATVSDVMRDDEFWPSGEY